MHVPFLRVMIDISIGKTKLPQFVLILGREYFCINETLSIISMEVCVCKLVSHFSRRCASHKKTKTHKSCPPQTPKTSIWIRQIKHVSVPEAHTYHVSGRSADNMIEKTTYTTFFLQYIIVITEMLAVVFHYSLSREEASAWIWWGDAKDQQKTDRLFERR